MGKVWKVKLYSGREREGPCVSGRRGRKKIWRRVIASGREEGKGPSQQTLLGAAASEQPIQLEVVGPSNFFLVCQSVFSLPRCRLHQLLNPAN